MTGNPFVYMEYVKYRRNECGQNTHIVSSHVDHIGVKELDHVPVQLTEDGVQLRVDGVELAAGGLLANFEPWLTLCVRHSLVICTHTHTHM